MLDGKADGCSQWFLSILAWEKPSARRVSVIRTRFTSSQLLLVHVQVQFLDFSIPRFSSILFTSLPFISSCFLLAHVLKDYVLLV